MMDTTLPALCSSALAIGVFHTLLGPDHYLPFVALSKARAWSRRRTLLITAGFGFAHTVGTVLLGAAGLALGAEAHDRGETRVVCTRVVCLPLDQT